MRLRPLVLSTTLAVLAGCGPADEPATVVPTDSDPTPTASAPPATTGRVAVDPDAQFVSYRRKQSQAQGSGGARIAGSLQNLDGCLVLEPGHLVIALDADRATFDGTALVLEPIDPGGQAVRARLGQQVAFGGGYGDFDDARSNPRVSVPRACAAIGSGEIAYVESW